MYRVEKGNSSMKSISTLEVTKYILQDMFAWHLYIYMAEELWLLLE